MKLLEVFQLLRVVSKSHIAFSAPVDVSVVPHPVKQLLDALGIVGQHLPDTRPVTKTNVVVDFFRVGKPHSADPTRGLIFAGTGVVYLRWAQSCATSTTGGGRSCAYRSVDAITDAAVVGRSLVVPHMFSKTPPRCELRVAKTALPFPVARHSSDCDIMSRTPCLL